MQAEPEDPGLSSESEDEGPELMLPRRAAAAASATPALDSHVPRKRKGKSTRWNIPKHALSRLEKVFIEDKFPSVETRKNLASELKVRPRQVQVWFQNKRQRSAKPPVKAGGVKDVQMLSTSVRAASQPAAPSSAAAASDPAAPPRARRRRAAAATSP